MAGPLCFWSSASSLATCHTTALVVDGLLHMVHCTLPGHTYTSSYLLACLMTVRATKIQRIVPFTSSSTGTIQGRHGWLSWPLALYRLLSCYTQVFVVYEIVALKMWNINMWNSWETTWWAMASKMGSKMETQSWGLPRTPSNRKRERNNGLYRCHVEVWVVTVFFGHQTSWCRNPWNPCNLDNLDTKEKSNVRLRFKYRFNIWFNRISIDLDKIIKIRSAFFLVLVTGT